MPEKTPGRTRKTPAKKSSKSAKLASVTPIGENNAPQPDSRIGNGEARVRSGENSLLELIRIRAYELFEERGRRDGFDQEDWARAEAEVLARFAREKSA